MEVPCSHFIFCFLIALFPLFIFPCVSVSYFSLLGFYDCIPSVSSILWYMSQLLSFVLWLLLGSCKKSFLCTNVFLLIVFYLHLPVKFQSFPPSSFMFIFTNYPSLFFAMHSFLNCISCFLFEKMPLPTLTFVLYLLLSPTLNKGGNFLLLSVSHLAHSFVSFCLFFPD